MDVEKVIKALECCSMSSYPACQECPYHELYSNSGCMNKRNADIENLIKRQQAEIERLQEIANPKCQQCVEQTRKDSFIEFAERLKSKAAYCSANTGEIILLEEDFDNTLKELTEVKDDEN